MTIIPKTPTAIPTDRLDDYDQCLLFGICVKCRRCAAEKECLHCEICATQIRRQELERKWREWGIAA